MTSRRVALPGLHSPSVGFDQPFDMLGACHERVRRSLDLLSRLKVHVAACGVDPSAREAARDVLRYFDKAAPLHHQDEERHVFPALLLPGAADVATVALVRQLQQEHADMEALWQQVRVPLLAWSEGGDAPLSRAEGALWQHFSAVYLQHVQSEDACIYPAATAQMDEYGLRAMGQEMAARRGA